MKFRDLLRRVTRARSVDEDGRDNSGAAISKRRRARREKDVDLIYQNVPPTGFASKQLWP